MEQRYIVKIRSQMGIQSDTLYKIIHAKNDAEAIAIAHKKYTIQYRRVKMEVVGVFREII